MYTNFKCQGIFLKNGIWKVVIKSYNRNWLTQKIQEDTITFFRSERSGFWLSYPEVKQPEYFGLTNEYLFYCCEVGSCSAMFGPETETNEINVKSEKELIKPEKSFCAICGNQTQMVKPGKYQCNYCEEQEYFFDLFSRIADSLKKSDKETDKELYNEVSIWLENYEGLKCDD